MGRKRRSDWRSSKSGSSLRWYSPATLTIRAGAPAQEEGGEVADREAGLEAVAGHPPLEEDARRR
jgi:hypothetical protein